jgi:hypothetical protein
MISIVDLAHCLGSPLLPGAGVQDLRESDDLLQLAFRNRVELIYLSNLKQAGLLKRLRPQWDEYRQRRDKTLECIVRIAAAMEEQQIPYAITKSLRPYPAIPNDTDLLYLGPLNDYPEALRRFERAGFVLSHNGDMQAEFFDPRGGEAFHRDKRGGKFYIDFYRQLAADRVPYINSDVLRQHVITRDIGGTPVKVFDPMAEMTILYLHSIIMHRTIPLEVLWCSAYWLAELDAGSLARFPVFIRNNRARTAAATVFGLMIELHREAYGQAPAVLGTLTAKVGLRQAELREWRRHQNAFPHVVRLSTFALALLEKMGETNSRKGFANQFLLMLHPSKSVEVMHHLLDRVQIQRHSTHV